MARDMYGNDGNFNGYLTSRPDGAFMPPGNDPYFYITGVTAAGRHAVQPDDQHPRERPGVLRLQLHPLDVAGHVQRHAHSGPAPGWSSRPSRCWPTPRLAAYRVFTVNIAPTDAATSSDQPAPTPTIYPPRATTPSCRAVPRSGRAEQHEPGHYVPFILDGRWLHAFNGPGMTTNAVHANFRYNGPAQSAP